MKLFSAMVLMTATLSLSACGGSKLEGAVEDWKSAACACKDKECALKQKEAFNKIESDFRSDIKEASKGTMRKLDKILDAANTCLKEFEVRAG